MPAKTTTTTASTITTPTPSPRPRSAAGGTKGSRNRKTTPATQGTSETTGIASAAVEGTTAVAAAFTAGIPAALAFQLPDLDAPAVSLHQPAASYKIAFGDTNRWYCSRDGGNTITPTATGAIAGAVIDLALQISPAHQREGDDYRLRLAFLDSSGELAELNLNSVSHNPEGTAYITSPARSLAGALLAISEADEDMRAFCNGARFSIRKGQGRGVFIETDIAVSDRWLAMSGAFATLRVAKDPETFRHQIEAIKRRFRACGLMLSGPAVLDLAQADDSSTPRSSRNTDD
jgi:hypothetical protein